MTALPPIFCTLSSIKYNHFIQNEQKLLLTKIVLKETCNSMKLDELKPVVSEEFDDPEKDFVEEELHAILGGKELMEALRWHCLYHGLAPLPRSVS